MDEDQDESADFSTDDSTRYDNTQPTSTHTPIYVADNSATVDRSVSNKEKVRACTLPCTHFQYLTCARPPTNTTTVQVPLLTTWAYALPNLNPNPFFTKLFHIQLSRLLPSLNPLPCRIKLFILSIRFLSLLTSKPQA